LRGAAIYPDVVHSDHCPVYAELDLTEKIAASKTN
jgi:exonuclease III